MKRLYLVLALIISLFIFAEENLYGQRRKPSKARSQGKQIARFRGGTVRSFGQRSYNSVSFSVNTMNYFGDLAPKPGKVSTDLSLTSLGFGLSFERKLAPRISVRGAFLYGRLRGSDFESADPNDANARFRYVRNLQFRNTIKELSVIGVFDLMPNYGAYITRQNVGPYGFVGLAVFHHNPKGLVPEFDVNNGNAPLADGGKWVDLEPLGTEGQYTANSGVKPYKKIQIAIPVGVGVRYKLNRDFDLAFEIGYRILFFDYLDDVSKNYIDLGSFNSDLARVMSERSRELNDVISGDPRDLTNPNVAEVYDRRFTYLGANGQSYEVVRGFGQPGPTNIRGNVKDNDIYISTSIKITYIIGNALFGGAKYR